MKLPILNKIKKYLSAAKSEEEEREAKNKAILESIGEGVIAVDKKVKANWKMEDVIEKVKERLGL